MAITRVSLPAKRPLSGRRDSCPGALLGLLAGADVAVDLSHSGSIGLWHGWRNRERSAIRGCSILPVCETPAWYNLLMTTPSENDSPTNSELLALLESTLDVIKGISDHQEVLIEHGKTLARQQADQAAIVRILVERSGAQVAAVNGFSAKLDGLTSDIAMVKGGHAVAAMHRNAALIADDLGCQLIEELPQGVIVGFAKVAADNGEPSSEVDSFRHADMVMYGREASGHPCYITVEASFTVNANDVRRAAQERQLSPEVHRNPIVCRGRRC